MMVTEEMKTKERKRPVSGLSNVMRVNIASHSQSLKQRKLKLQKIMSYRLPKLESEDPETTYSWISSFENSLKSCQIGKSYEYPESKFNRSKEIANSQGYRTAIYMHRQKSRYNKYKHQVMPSTTSICESEGLTSRKLFSRQQGKAEKKLKLEISEI